MRDSRNDNSGNTKGEAVLRGALPSRIWFFNGLEEYFCVKNHTLLSILQNIAITRYKTRYVYCFIVDGMKAKREIIEQLQKQILALQDYRIPGEVQSSIGLGQIESAFPAKVFPQGAVHELISLSPESASSTNAFISVLLGKLMRQKGCCIWISSRRSIFPPALKTLGVEPDRILFVDAWRLKDALWTIEEALKCDALSAVVGEVSELSFNDSRRLQLAVEKSRVTAFIHRQMPKTINVVACVTRWKINPLSSSSDVQMPGLGFPRWDVQLLKVRNGKPGHWVIQWGPQGLEYISENISTSKVYERKTA